jgi:hypothetical protein
VPEHDQADGGDQQTALNHVLTFVLKNELLHVFREETTPCTVLRRSLGLASFARPKQRDPNLCGVRKAHVSGDVWSR